MLQSVRIDGLALCRRRPNLNRLVHHFALRESDGRMMVNPQKRSEMTLHVAIGGFGAIGKVVARRLDGGIGGLALAAVAARNIARAQSEMADFRRKVPVVPLARLWEEADIVVEAAPAALLREIAEPALAHGRTLMVLSCGALLDNFDLVDLAQQQGGRILVPTGALLGLDAVTAAAEDRISRVNIITRKPPLGLLGAPYLEERGVDIAGLAEAKRVFAGTAREAARGFPANVNVAAALALAGIGPDLTTIEIWADPTITRNIHRIEVEAAAARLSMQIENVPSEENPRTGRLTALSVIAALRKLSSPLAIGT
jgi:aspartate dehydrogenase